MKRFSSVKNENLSKRAKVRMLEGRKSKLTEDEEDIEVEADATEGAAEGEDTDIVGSVASLVQALIDDGEDISPIEEVINAAAGSEDDEESEDDEDFDEDEEIDEDEEPLEEDEESDDSEEDEDKEDLEEARKARVAEAKRRIAARKRIAEAKARVAKAKRIAEAKARVAKAKNLAEAKARKARIAEAKARVAEAKRVAR